MKTKKIYIVQVGIIPGVYFNWDDCKEMVNGVQGSLFKSFKNTEREECLSYINEIKTSESELATFINIAEDWFDGSFVKSKVINPKPNKKHTAIKKKSKAKGKRKSFPTSDFYACDAGTHGNNIKMGSTCEFQIYCSKADKMIYSSEKMIGSNNIGEFLGLVKTIALMESGKLERRPIYSDSLTAIAWVRKKKCNSAMEAYSREHQKTMDKIDIAEQYLISAENRGFKVKILKWETTSWGENPADYGRK